MGVNLVFYIFVAINKYYIFCFRNWEHFKILSYWGYFTAEKNLMNTTEYCLTDLHEVRVKDCMRQTILISVSHHDDFMT